LKFVVVENTCLLYKLVHSQRC